MSDDLRWQPRGLFVSSTFEDMHAERDYLQRIVLPALAERLRACRRRLVSVDLRWGIDTLPVAGGDEQRQLLVLRFCLQSAVSCRPFFLALLGDRYGWIPPDDAMRKAAQEIDYQGAVEGRSITALEIESSLFGASSEPVRGHVFLRRLPYDVMDPASRARFSDAHRAAQSDDRAVQAEASRAASLLADLKQRIAQRLPPERLHTYDAQWDREQHRVVGLQALGEQIIEQVGRELEQYCRRGVVREPGDWQAAEREQLDEFLDSRLRVFCGRESLVDRLSRFCQSADGERQALALVGPAGAGKSSLIAALHRRLASDGNRVLLTHAAGISRRSTSPYDLLQRWSAELAAHLGERSSLAEDLDLEPLRERFAGLLWSLAHQRRVVLLVDALNQFDPLPDAAPLVWLPRTLPDNVRLLATTLPGAEAEELAGRPGAAREPVPPLDAASIDAVFREVCSSLYHRQGDGFAAVRAALSNKADGQGERAGGNPLWLRLALDLLNQRDEDFFAQQHRPELAHLPADQRLTHLLCELVAEMPPDVAGLYDWLLQQSEQVARHFGSPGWARALAEYLALSRYGLRESDLRELLRRRLPDEPWSDLRLAALRRSFAAHLIERGDMGQWDFFHAQMRQAVARRYLAEPGAATARHRHMAEHLDRLPAEDLLRQREILHHWLQAGAMPEAARCYASVPEGLAQNRATAVLVQHVAGQGRAGLDDALALVAVPGLPAEQRLNLAVSYQYDLPDALRNLARLSTRAALLDAAGQLLEALGREQPEDLRVLRERVANHVRRAEMAMSLGLLAETEQTTGTALALARHLADLQPDDPANQRDLIVALNRVGDYQAASGLYEPALDHYNEALARARALLEAQPDSPAALRDVSISLERLGELSLEHGDLAGARDCYDESLQLSEQLAADTPDVQPQRDLSIAWERLGIVYRRAGRMPGARHCYTEVVRIRQQLAGRFPHEIQMQRDLGVALFVLGSMSLDEGQRAEASTHFHQFHALALRLAAQLPDDLQAQRDVTLAQLRLGDLGPASEAHYRAALEHAQALAARHPDEPGPARDVSLALNHLGDLLVRTSRLGEAEYCYTEALRLREGLSAARPDDVQARRDVSVSLCKLGDLHRRTGNLDAARCCCEDDLGIARDLVARQPGDVQAQRDLSISLERLGDLHRRQGRTGEALGFYCESLELCRDLAARQPDDVDTQRDLAISLDRVGDLHRVQGRIPHASACYHEAVTIRRNLARQLEDDPRALRDVTISLVRLGDLLRGEGQIPGASAVYDEALQITQSLAEALPEHLDVQRDLSLALGRQGELHRRAGRLDIARNWYEAALGQARALRNRVPRMVEVERDLALALERLGQLDSDANRIEQARQCFRESLEITTALAQEQPHDVQVQRDLSVALFSLGDLAVTEGHFAEAQRYFEQAHDQTCRLVEQMPDDVQVLRDLSVALERLGDRYRAQRRLVEAGRCYLQDLEIARRLIERMPGEVQTQRDLSLALGRVGDLLRDTNRIAAARACYDEAADLRRNLYARMPDDPQTIRDLAIALQRQASLPDWPTNRRQTIMTEALTLLARITHLP